MRTLIYVKTCNHCGETKEEQDFYANQARCKPCQRTYDRDYYQRNKERRQAANQRWLEGHIEWFNSLKDHPCVDCGERFHHAAMHWDHLPGSSKLNGVGALKTRSRQRILDEIAKCELVCANCHAVRTYTRLLGANG